MDKRSVLLLKIPQNNNKNEAAADGFFTQIGEILKGKKVIITAEIAIFGKFLWFFLTCPNSIKDLVKGQWYSQYHTTEIQEIKDYAQKVIGNFSNGYFSGPCLASSF